MKVKALREFLEGLPDDAEVVVDVIRDHHRMAQITWVYTMPGETDIDVPNVVIIETGI